MTGPEPGRILAQRHVTAMVALDTITPIAARVAKLLTHGRRITIARRYTGSDGVTRVTAGLAVAEVRVRTGEHGGGGIGVHLKPTEGFGLHAYPGDLATEREAWDRYHRHDRGGLVKVVIDGGLPNDGPARDDQLVIRRWNSYGGVCEEIVVAFDYGPDRQQTREDVAKHLWVEGGGDPAAWDRLADAAWALRPDQYLSLDYATKRERLLATADQVLAIAYADAPAATR